MQLLKNKQMPCFPSASSREFGLRHSQISTALAERLTIDIHVGLLNRRPSSITLVPGPINPGSVTAVAFAMQVCTQAPSHTTRTSHHYDVCYLHLTFFNALCGRFVTPITEYCQVADTRPNRVAEPIIGLALCYPIC